MKNGNSQKNGEKCENANAKLVGKGEPGHAD
jgi:hypothetical protein